VPLFLPPSLLTSSKSMRLSPYWQKGVYLNLVWSPLGEDFAR